MTAEEVKQLLQLEPLRMEGGFFRETYRSRWKVSEEYLPEGMHGSRSIGTAIYFLITPQSSPGCIACPAPRSFTSTPAIP
jgi:hypothetical protein